MKIIEVPLESLKPYERNAKRHPVTQLQSLLNSIKQFGFLQPLVIDRNNIIVAGHGRYEAAATLGMAKVPCVIVDDLTEGQIKAYRILDNKIAESGWDNELLKLELQDIDFDFEPFDSYFEGFSDINLDDVAEPPKEDKDEFLVVINCKNETTQKDVYEELSLRGFECKLMM